MNKFRLFLLIGILSLGTVLFVYKSNQKLENSETNTSQRNNIIRSQDDQASPTRGNCLADDCLLVEDLEYPVGELPTEVQEALDEAINDEYKALSTYEAVVAKFGMVRPFSMIIGAEEQHIASLKAVYDKYGLEVPINNWPSKVSVPTTLQESCQVGVEAEIANADLYKKELMPVVKDYEDITAVFQNLMSASEEKHLPAFERCN